MKILACCSTKAALFAWLVTSLTSCLSLAGQGAVSAQSAHEERSTVLTLTIGGASKQLSAGDLAAMPQTRVTVHDAHSGRDEVYTGVALCDLLSANGLPFTKETQRAYLHTYLRAQGTDFYFAIYSAAEVIPELHISQVIVATHVDGRDLGGEGLFKLVSTGDRRPARWVRNLISITLITVN